MVFAPMRSEALYLTPTTQMHSGEPVIWVVKLNIKFELAHIRVQFLTLITFNLRAVTCTFGPFGNLSGKNHAGWLTTFMAICFWKEF